jgi:hypothetical protein
MLKRKNPPRNEGGRANASNRDDGFPPICWWQMLKRKNPPRNEGGRANASNRDDGFPPTLA